MCYQFLQDRNPDVYDRIRSRARSGALGCFTLPPTLSEYHADPDSEESCEAFRVRFGRSENDIEADHVKPDYVHSEEEEVDNSEEVDSEGVGECGDGGDFSSREANGSGDMQAKPLKVKEENLAESGREQGREGERVWLIEKELIATVAAAQFRSVPEAESARGEEGASELGGQHSIKLEPGDSGDDEQAARSQDEFDDGYEGDQEEGIARAADAVSSSRKRQRTSTGSRSEQEHTRSLILQHEFSEADKTLARYARHGYLAALDHAEIWFEMPKWFVPVPQPIKERWDQQNEEVERTITDRIKALHNSIQGDHGGPKEASISGHFGDDIERLIGSICEMARLSTYNTESTKVAIKQVIRLIHGCYVAMGGEHAASPDGNESWLYSADLLLHRLLNKADNVKNGGICQSHKEKLLARLCQSAAELQDEGVHGYFRRTIARLQTIQVPRGPKTTSGSRDDYHPWWSRCGDQGGYASGVRL